PVDYPQSGAGGTEYITVADFNHDGHLDVATAETPHSLGVMLGNGNGSFTPLPLLTTNDRPASVVAADFHNSGNLDLLVSGGQPFNITGIYLDPFQGDGSGFFTPETPIVLASSGYAQGTMGLGDFNEDGNADVAIGLNTGTVSTNFIWI